MKLYVGGAWQGQDELARAENPGAEVFSGFHETVRVALAEGKEPRAFAEAFCQAHPDAVVTADEIGSGIVPMDASDRAWREACGRALCVIAGRASQVTRVVCGIGVRIK